MICSTVIPRPSHYPVFDHFQHVKAPSDHKWMVGKPQKETNFAADAVEVKSPSMSCWLFSHAKFYLEH